MSQQHQPPARGGGGGTGGGVDRLTYVPRGKRGGGGQQKKTKRQQRQPQQSSSSSVPRFHGAFTGGFSAGYFNSVGTEDGWQPSAADGGDGGGDRTAADDEQRPRRGRREQRLEDFMDEQDHDEWGGPTSLSSKFRVSAAAAPTREPEATTIKRRRKAGKEGGDAGTTTTAADDGAMGTVAAGVRLLPPEEAEAAGFQVRVPTAHQNIGRRLLRLLGWREGESAVAYVPQQDEEAGETRGGKDEEADGDRTHQDKVLSKKKLRKILLQQRRVEIPQPKLDQCGLGYEPFENAPEFRAHREKRQKLAQLRAKQTTAAAGGGRNVYRVSDVLDGGGVDGADDGGDDKGRSIRPRKEQPRQDDPDDPYVSYETAEDFVGSKSVGGFALRDDADDAYDDDLLSGERRRDLLKVSDNVRVDRDAYDTVAYEHEESDNEDVQGNRDKSGASGAAAFDQALSSWAGADASGRNSKLDERDSRSDLTTSAGVVTSDGRPLVPGFVLAVESSSLKMQRFRGPDLPPNYDVKRHNFSPMSRPQILKALSHAAKLEEVDLRRKAAMEDALKLNTVDVKKTPTLPPPPPPVLLPPPPLPVLLPPPPPPVLLPPPPLPLSLPPPPLPPPPASTVAKPPPTEPLGGGTFAGLSSSMSSRFTPSQSMGEESHIGADVHPRNETVRSKVPKITRTLFSFSPEPLLCKRFNVKVPTSNSGSIPSIRMKEKTSGHDEILVMATEARAKKCEAVKAKRKGVIAAAHPPPTLETGDGGGEDNLSRERPSMELYKSIFDPSSSSDEGEASGSDIEEELEPAKVDTRHAEKVQSANERDDGKVRSRKENPSSDESSHFESDEDRRGRRRRKKRDRKEKKKMKHERRHKEEKSKKRKRKEKKRSRRSESD